MVNFASLARCNLVCNCLSSDVVPSRDLPACRPQSDNTSPRRATAYRKAIFCAIHPDARHSPPRIRASCRPARRQRPSTASSRSTSSTQSWPRMFKRHSDNSIWPSVHPCSRRIPAGRLWNAPLSVAERSLNSTPLYGVMSASESEKSTLTGGEELENISAPGW